MNLIGHIADGAAVAFPFGNFFDDLIDDDGGNSFTLDAGSDAAAENNTLSPGWTFNNFHGLFACRQIMSSGLGNCNLYKHVDDYIKGSA